MGDTDDKCAYARGYAAGRKRTEAEMENSEKEWRLQTEAYTSFRAQVFCAALQGAMVGAWRVGDKMTDENVVKAAVSFTERAIKSFKP